MPGGYGVWSAASGGAESGWAGRATSRRTADGASPRWPNRLLGLSAALALGCCGCSALAVRGLNAEGVRLYSQSRFPEAIEKFQQAIATDPASADGYYNLAATYHRLAEANRRQEDAAQAERYYHLALDRDPNHRDSYRGLAVLLVQQDRGLEAVRLLQDWAQRNPSSPDSKIELARLSEEFGERQAAKQYLADALLADPNNARALAALGRLRELEGDPAQALANYQQSLLADRFQPDVAARVAMLQATTGLPAPVAPEAAEPRLVTRPSGAVR